MPSPALRCRRALPWTAFSLAALALTGCRRTEDKDAPGDTAVDTAPETDAPDTDSGVDSPPDTGSPEDLPPPGVAWTRDERTSPGSVTFTEIAWNPAADAPTEWIELHNPMSIDADLSGWTLDGGVDFEFPDGSRIAPGGYAVVAADPAALAKLGVPDAWGPWTGALDNDGERITLRSVGDRRIDSVAYGEDDPWPVAPDGTGATLAKLEPDAASDRAEHWAASAQLGGTPGRENGLDPDAPPTTIELVPADATWRYDTSGAYPAADWAAADYDDGAWASGEATFYAGAPEAAATATLSLTADNYYAAYLGEADGTDLRLVAEDADGAWWTVESYEAEATPRDHLFVAAWEAPSDYGGPQMVIAQATVDGAVLGTSAATFEWVLGPTDGCPGTTPPDPPPDEAEVAALVADAEAAGDWALPAVDAGRESHPWGGYLGASFDSVTRYVWPDTFSDTSVTNTENTYALFRSIDPVLGGAGTTELDDVPTTTTFRVSFDFADDPARATLLLACELDDGAVFWLNGTEVHRENMPGGAVTASTLAAGEVTDDPDVYATFAGDALVRGRNVLAVEVHQAERPDDDLLFGCSLHARIAAVATPTVRIHEVPGAGHAPFWAELASGDTAADTAVTTTGLVLASASGELVLPAGELGPGELLLLDDVGFAPAEGEVLALYAADRATLLDAVRVGDRPRARHKDDAGDAGDAWRYPIEATPGAANAIELVTDVVITELMYHRAPLATEGAPCAERDEEWIELHNRGAAAVDLEGWRLVDAVAYEFPAGATLEPGGYLVVSNGVALLQAAYPEAAVLGDFEGGLGNSGERVLLLDARGNPADEVRYGDDGRWPGAADGGGASLELRHPDADNAAPEAWAASDETARTAWVDVEIRDVASPSAVGPDGTWQELVLGLLDEGEVLIDDLRVVQDPDGAAIDVLQNGAFDDADHWRIIGNHRHSGIVPDPDDPGNPVLRLVATGPTEHMHNHAETTLTRAISSVPYAITFRARWVSGSNQLHTRLYFNRMPHTTLLPTPDASGTPGAPNSMSETNLGPTFTDLAQSVAVPAPGEPVDLAVDIADPDGVADATLWAAVDGGPWTSLPMTETDGRWTATLPGESAGTIVQLYVEATDTLGAAAWFPAAGPDARALLTFDDGRAATNGLHNLRILMTEADADWMHDDVNLMSNDPLGATVVYDESEVYYDVGVRTKGSERGRPSSVRLGFGLRFPREAGFRGSHTSVLVDRSEGVNFGQRELLHDLVGARVGLVSAEHNDLVQVITPRNEHTGSAVLQLDRFSSLVLDAQFDAGSAGGADGFLYDYELVYYPTTTDDGTAEGAKLPQPDGVVGTAIRDLGSDKEAYRWSFLVQNNERADDYAAILALGELFSQSGAPFLAQADDVIDVDQWLRAFAFATLSGAGDQYGGDGAQHNARFYARPEDGRVLYFPHDLDYFFGATMSIVGNSDLARLLADPVYDRLYYQHLLDILDRAYNATWLEPWCDQIGELLPAQNWDYACDFAVERAAWARSGSSDSVLRQHPQIPFVITTNGGADVTTKAAEILLEGEGWVDVREIWLDGAPLPVTWRDGTTWEATVPLEKGKNRVELVARSLAGAEVGRDSLVVTRHGG